MDVSIIIVNYNTINLLCNTVDSVMQKTSKLIYEIIVVDNNSKDNSKQIINDKYSEKVKYISLSENIGFGRANNEGIQIAKGRNIFLLNPDTILENNGIKILSDYLDDNRKVGVVGGNLLNEDGSPQPSYTHFYPSINLEIVKLFHLVFLFKNDFYNETTTPKFVKTVYGAAMMVRKSVIQEVGGFDPRFFMYAEEDEWCHRIKKAGYKIVNIPQCVITHLDGRSFEFSEERNKRQLDGLRVLYRVTYSANYCRILRVIEYLVILNRLILYKLLGNKDKLNRYVFLYNNRKWK